MRELLNDTMEMKEIVEEANGESEKVTAKAKDPSYSASLYRFCRADLGLDAPTSFVIAYHDCSPCIQSARTQFGLSDEHVKIANEVSVVHKQLTAKSFPGKKGEKFKNCVKHFMNKEGFKPKKGRTKEESAAALCAFIGRKHGKI